MEWESLSEKGHPERTFVLVFETGDEVIEQLTRFANETGITAARFTAIGGFSRVVLAYFNPEETWRRFRAARRNALPRPPSASFPRMEP